MRASSKNERLMKCLALELSFSHLNVAIAQERPDGEVEVTTRSIPWRDKATSLQEGDGPAEFSQTLRDLVGEYKLQGAELRVALNGDFCVTRVVTGTNEKVASELDNLENRSNLYLSLGHGPKALGASVRDIDARHQHALLTVVNQNLLDILVNVAAECGLRIELVESSLVALARLVGHVTADDDKPKLIVNLGERGVEVGIARSGQLLLDYRPPAQAIHERLAQLIASHLVRLQRYCDRHVGLTTTQLEAAFLCGHSEGVAVLAAGFARQQTEAIQVVAPDFSRLPLTFTDETPGPEMLGALGTLLADIARDGDAKTPNLMERVQAAQVEPLWPAVKRTMWPIAAVVASAALLVAASWARDWQASRIHAEHEQLREQQRELGQQALQRAQNGAKLTALSRIKARLTNPRFDELAARIAQCLPDDVWLEGVTVDRDGQMVLAGASLSQDGAFEFERWLQQLPLVERVSLSGAEASQTAGRGSVVNFSVRCGIVGYQRGAGNKGQRNGNG